MLLFTLEVNRSRAGHAPQFWLRGIYPQTLRKIYGSPNCVMHAPVFVFGHALLVQQQLNRISFIHSLKLNKYYKSTVNYCKYTMLQQSIISVGTLCMVKTCTGAGPVIPISASR